MMMSGILGLVLLVVLSTIISLNVAIRRKKRIADVYNTYPEKLSGLLSHQSITPPLATKNIAPPPPPMVAQLPPGGLPDGWTMEQWHYYGEEYLRRLR